MVIRRIYPTFNAGLADSAVSAILAALSSEAQSMAGELILGHLCELALDLITGHNVPEGECAFCLEPLVPESNRSGGAIAVAPAVTKLVCFHAFHERCFSAWFRWQQRQLAAREAEVRLQYKSMAPMTLQKEEIWSEEVHLGSATNPEAPVTRTESDSEGDTSHSNAERVQVYAVKCPRCRTEVPPASLGSQLRPLLSSSARQQGGNMTKAASWSCEVPPLSQVLQPEALQQLHDLQRRFASVLELQSRCNGLVEENVAVSLGDMQAAAENSRLAAATAMSAAEAQDKAGNSSHHGGNPRHTTAHESRDVRMQHGAPTRNHRGRHNGVHRPAGRGKQGGRGSDASATRPGPGRSGRGGGRPPKPPGNVPQP